MESQPTKQAPQDQKPSKKASSKPTPGKWDEMNRKQRREMMRKMQSEDLNLEVVHPHAAGIDIGNESHYVAVPPSRDPQPVRCFGCTTAELKKMAEWLTQSGIRTVALQSTGVYWIAVYDILEAAGLEVYLVNEAAHLRLIAKFVSSVAGDSHAANVLAATPRSGAQYRSSYTTHAEGDDADEYPVGQRDQRHHRSDRAGHPESDSEWGTRSPGIGGVSGLPD